MCNSSRISSSSVPGCIGQAAVAPGLSVAIKKKDKGRSSMSRFRLTLFSAIGVLMLGAVLTAQSSKGIVVGTVTDTTGARVPGATVKVTSLDTNVAREKLTLNEGTFRIDALDPGNYRIEVSLTGFK